jgi:3-deoxy-manno-octulosonate cytidylyltransferase (CMP-KDO synthetase)
MTKVVIGIPARMGSTRFPGKPLCQINGIPMIEHVYKRCSFAKNVAETVVATCDEEIAANVLKIGGKVIMTGKNISRPGLRVANACEKLNLKREDIVVVVQGDEPLVHPEMIGLAIQPLLDETDVFVSNLCAEATDQDLDDPAEIKVVCDNQMNALYMSRAAIPCRAHMEEKTKWWRQVCIMAFRWHFLKKFNHELRPTALEKQESIEMLRAIQHGYKVRMVPHNYVSKSVDTEQDRAMVEELMKYDMIFPFYKKNE